MDNEACEICEMLITQDARLRADMATLIAAIFRHKSLTAGPSATAKDQALWDTIGDIGYPD